MANEFITPERVIERMMMPRSDTAYHLARAIVNSRAEVHMRQRDLPNPCLIGHSLDHEIIDDDWARSVLKACEDAIAHQDRVIDELRRVALKVINERIPAPMVFIKGEPL